jgi:hypothetical protein
MVNTQNKTHTTQLNTTHTKLQTIRSITHHTRTKVLLNLVPQLSFLKVWGCEAYVKRLMSDKLTPKSDKCFFVGYPRETKGYYFYNKEEGKVFVAHNGVFLEKEFLSKGLSGSKVQLEEIEETLETVSAPTEDPQDVQDVAQTVVEAPAPRRFIRARRATDKLNLLITEEHHVLLMENDEPMTYTEAKKGPDSDKWLKAMESELNSMHDNQIWNLVNPIEGVRHVDCK